MPVKTLQDLLVDQLKDIYDAEHRLLDVIPRLARAATSTVLKTALGEHMIQTEHHVERLDDVFESFGQQPKGATCEAMKGLIIEAESLANASDDKAVNDAAIVAAAQKIEHYEIATYGTLREWARQLGRPEIVALLKDTLNEEAELDRQLSELAATLNLEAASVTRGR